MVLGLNSAMSEYIEIESDSTEDPNVMIVHTNLALATGNPERYESVEAMEEGSAVAQALAPIEGIVKMRIETNDLIVEIDAQAPWHLVESEIAAALKDFFL